MTDALALLGRALRADGPAAEGVRWEDLTASLEEIASGPLAPAAEQLLLDVVGFEGRLRLDPASELPHSLSPEDMLRSLAIQALTKWTGLTHLPEVRRAPAVAASPMLRAVADAGEKRTRAGAGPAR